VNGSPVIGEPKTIDALDDRGKDGDAAARPV
jgi:hypothetical protein